MAYHQDPNKIIIFDTTLRDGEQALPQSLSVQQKLQIAMALDQLGVDVIETGFPISSEGDFQSVQTISRSLRHAIPCGLARCVPKDVEACGNAMKGVDHFRIHTFIATSDIHVQDKLKKSREDIMAMASACVKLARNYTDDVEFSCEDAGRTPIDYLCQMVENAIKAGATTINIPDTVGYSYPEEMKDLFRFLLSSVKDADKVNFAVHCHNDIGLAVANTLAAIEAGATQAELTVNGIGERAGNAALEEVVMALNVRKDFYLTETNINTRQIYPSSQLLSSITGVKIHPTKPLVGKNAFLHESGIHQHGVLANRATYEIISPESLGIIQNDIVLGKHSGKHAFKDFLEGMDVRVSNEELNILFARFKEIADKKNMSLHLYKEKVEGGSEE